MGKGKIIVVHLAVFLILISILFITSELILNKFASGIHNVGLWMELTIVGTAGIFILTTISCLIFLKQKINKEL